MGKRLKKGGAPGSGLPRGLMGHGASLQVCYNGASARVPGPVSCNCVSRLGGDLTETRGRISSCTTAIGDGNQWGDGGLPLLFPCMRAS
jgi:hypothetical protein